MIKRMSTECVHDMKSQQYVQNTFIIIKELIENSLDANATEIRISIDNENNIIVEDNGNGIDFNSLDLLGNEGCTSKEDVSGFVISQEEMYSNFKHGFRGQALYSFRHMSDLIIITRTKDMECGYMKSFPDNITRKHARDIGTTVKINNIFKNSDIRRRELSNNIGKDIIKIINIIKCYCLINKVKIIFSHKKKNYCESGNGKIKEYIQRNYSNYFIENNYLEIKNEKFEFYLGNKGYRNKDFQFIFLDLRIVQSPAISKTINDTFKMFYQGNPIFILQIRQPGDFNLSVDKTRIVLPNEKELICILKSEIEKFFSKNCFLGANNTFKNKTGGSEKLENIVSFINKEPNKNEKSNFIEKKNYKEDNNLVDENDFTKPEIKTHKKRTNSKTTDLIDDDWNDQKENKSNISTIITPIKRIKKNFVSRKVKEDSSSETYCFENEKVTEPDILKVREQQFNLESYKKQKSSLDEIGEDNQYKFYSLNNRLNDSEHNIPNYRNMCYNVNENSNNVKLDISDLNSTLDNIDQTVNDVKYNISESESNNNNVTDIIRNDALNCKPDENKASSFFFESIENCLFKSVKIEKEDFLKMNVIGQFNKGFILCEMVKVNIKYLLIVDQHAADEIRNYETLQNNFCLKRQNLLVPFSLQVNAAEEFLIKEYQHILKRNGFIINENMMLTCVPFYKNTILNKEDLFDLLEEIKKSNTSTDTSTVKKFSPIFCSKIKDIMASKACRSSIMIGKHLRMIEMKKLVSNLYSLRNPWKCPHGRPVLKVLYVKNI